MVSKATHIVDGDTFDFEFGRIRLADIDAPEFGEPGYGEAKSYLTDLILGETIWVDVDDSGSTSHNRIICVVYVRHNSTHLINVNSIMNSSGHAVLDDHPDNEFNPDLWTDYVEIGRLISCFSHLYEYNLVRTVYPSNAESKPLGCGKAMETDWLASAFITSTLNNYSEALDVEENFVNQTSGKVFADPGCGVISFGGPFVNPVAKYAESEDAPEEDRAPVKFHLDGTTFRYQHVNGTDIPGAELPESVINDDQDMFLIEVFKDGDGRFIMLCYGFCWKGTYAAGKYFSNVIYPDLESWPYSWVIVKWEDTNGNGFVNTEPDGDVYTLIAHSRN